MLHGFEKQVEMQMGTDFQKGLCKACGAVAAVLPVGCYSKFALCAAVKFTQEDKVHSFR